MNTNCSISQLEAFLQGNVSANIVLSLLPEETDFDTLKF